MMISLFDQVVSIIFWLYRTIISSYRQRELAMVINLNQTYRSWCGNIYLGQDQ